ncbi:MAG: methyltransferase domain-containing protein [Desulfobacterales bacterium]
MEYGLRKIDRAYNIELYSSMYSKDSVKKKNFYNIGAGGFSHPCWTNVDYDSQWYKSNRSKTLQGIQYDLFSLDPLPIESESAEIVYSSHSVEHVNDEAAQNIFNESYRILKPAGYIRIVTPNIDLEYRAYKEDDREFFFWIDKYSIPKNYKRMHFNQPFNDASIDQIFLAHFATSVSVLHSDGAPERIDDNELNRIFNAMDYEEALNYICTKCPIEIQKKYPGNHMNWWNKKKMFSMLSQAGFKKIYLSGYGQSYCHVLRDIMFFDNTNPKIALYIEAIK